MRWRTAEQKQTISRGPQSGSSLILCEAPQKPQKSMTYHQWGHHTKESKEGAVTSPLLWESDSLPLSKSCCLWRRSRPCHGQALSPWDQCPVTCIKTTPKACCQLIQPEHQGTGQHTWGRMWLRGRIDCGGVLKFILSGPTPWNSGSVGLGWDPGTCILNKVQRQCQCSAGLGNLGSRELGGALLFLILSLAQDFFTLLVLVRKKRVGKGDLEESKAKWRAL